MSNLDRAIIIVMLIAFIAAWICGAIQKRKERRAEDVQAKIRVRKQEVERAARKAL